MFKFLLLALIIASPLCAMDDTSIQDSTDQTITGTATGQNLRK